MIKYLLSTSLLFGFHSLLMAQTVFNEFKVPVFESSVKAKKIFLPAMLEKLD